MLLFNDVMLLGGTVIAEFFIASLTYEFIGINFAELIVACGFFKRGCLKV